MRLLACLLALFLSCVALAAEVYTWRDKDGKVHYSDTPPSGDIDPRRINASGTPASSADARKNLANQELEFRKRRGEQAEAQAKADAQQSQDVKRKANCEASREQLSALESGARMYRTNSKGEREYFDDTVRAQEAAKARQAVSEWCK